MSSLYSQLFRVGGLRFLGLVVGFGVNFYAARLLIQTYGPSGYGAIATVMALPSLFPFADLGFGNAVVNAYAAQQRQRREVLRIAVVVTGICAVILSGLSLFAFESRLLSEVLGAAVMREFPGADRVALFILIVTWSAMPFGLAYRLVQGEGRLHVAMAWQLLVPPLSIVILWLLVGPFFDSGLAPMYLAVSTLAVAFLFFVHSVVPSLLTSRNLLKSWKNYFMLVLKSGLPSLVISLMLALSFQTGRIVLSHFSTGSEVVNYSLGLLLYAPTFALFSVSAQHLWSHYARERANRRMTARLLWNNIGVYGLLSACGMLGLFLLGNWIIATFVHGGSDLRFLFLAFGGLLLVQAVHLPSAMLLTSPRDLKWQAAVLIICALLTISLSVVFAPVFGAVGIVFAGILPVLTIQFPLTVRRALAVIRMVP